MYIPDLRCPTCNTKMQKKEENGNPVWYCHVKDCPCEYLEGKYNEI
jgi:ribosomal protein L37AE/L43A